MAYDVGDRVIYQEEDVHRKHLLGEIVDVWKSSKEKRITGYFVILDSGEFVHIQPDNSRWRKVIYVV